MDWVLLVDLSFILSLFLCNTFCWCPSFSIFLEIKKPNQLYYLLVLKFQDKQNLGFRDSLSWEVTSFRWFAKVKQFFSLVLMKYFEILLNYVRVSEIFSV